MKAKPGDRIVITPPTVGGTIRDGEILEARGPDGGPPFRVRWSDGHEGLIYPSEGRIVHHEGPAESRPAPTATTAKPTAPAGGVPHVRDWTVRISVYEAGDETDAHVVLLADSPTHLSASGHSHRCHEDSAVPEIGDEVAVARALRHLADQLLTTAVEDIETVTGENDVYLKAQ